jgi:hypothetical protein
VKREFPNRQKQLHRIAPPSANGAGRGATVAPPVVTGLCAMCVGPVERIIDRGRRGCTASGGTLPHGVRRVAAPLQRSKYGGYRVLAEIDVGRVRLQIAADNPDVSYMLALLAELKATYAVDPRRNYMNGVSMGSGFTNRMAVQFPEMFAAIAPCYSGHLSPANYANAIVRTDVPIPTWLCRGEAEVPSDLPGGTAGETASQVFWRETVNRNTGQPTLQLDGRKVMLI